MSSRHWVCVRASVWSLASIVQTSHPVARSLTRRERISHSRKVWRPGILRSNVHLAPEIRQLQAISLSTETAVNVPVELALARPPEIADIQ
jgi:hypothetical protein